MASLEQYADQYQNIRFERQERHPADDLPHQWRPPAMGRRTSRRIPPRLLRRGQRPRESHRHSDRHRRLFLRTPGNRRRRSQAQRPAQWDSTYWEGKKLLGNLLDIEVPMIAAVNGPALRHSEIPSALRHRACRRYGRFPGLRPLHEQPCPGRRRPRCLPDAAWGEPGAAISCSQASRIGAQEALNLGLVGEVMPQDALLPRAWELAEQLAEKSDLVLRYTRVATTQYIKRQMQDLLRLRSRAGGPGLRRLPAKPAVTIRSLRSNAASVQSTPRQLGGSGWG